MTFVLWNSILINIYLTRLIRISLSSAVNGWGSFAMTASLMNSVHFSTNNASRSALSLLYAEPISSEMCYVERPFSSNEWKVLMFNLNLVTFPFNNPSCVSNTFLHLVDSIFNWFWPLSVSVIRLLSAMSLVTVFDVSTHKSWVNIPVAKFAGIFRNKFLFHINVIHGSYLPLRHVCQMYIY